MKREWKIEIRFYSTGRDINYIRLEKILDAFCDLLGAITGKSPYFRDVTLVQEVKEN